MKKPLFILLFSVGCFLSAFSQNNSLNAGISRTMHWHFLNADYHHTFRNDLDLKLGIGFNVTQFFNENYMDYKLFLRPFPEQFSDRFSLNYGIQKYFAIQDLPTRWYLSYDHSLMKTKFIYKSYYVVDSIPYSQILTVDKGLLFNHSLSVGLDTKLLSGFNFNCNVGLNHIMNEHIGNQILKLRLELGFAYNFRKRKEEALENR